MYGKACTGGGSKEPLRLHRYSSYPKGILAPLQLLRHMSTHSKGTSDPSPTHPNGPNPLYYYSSTPSTTHYSSTPFLLLTTTPSLLLLPTVLLIYSLYNSLSSTPSSTHLPSTPSSTHLLPLYYPFFMRLSHASFSKNYFVREFWSARKRAKRDLIATVGGALIGIAFM